MTSKSKPKAKPKLTDAERHKRFVETAKEVGASDDPKDFDRSFKRVAVPFAFEVSLNAPGNAPGVIAPEPAIKTLQDLANLVDWIVVRLGRLL